MARLDFSPKNLSADIVSGAVTGLISIPDAIASAILAGVNPTYGFNALMTGTPIGSLFSGTQFMNIGLTSAMMLAVSDVLIEYDEPELLPALFTLTVMVGLFQLVLGLFKLGKFTKFISNSVMVGFITGIAVVVILGQLGDFTGYSSSYSRSIAKGVDTLLHPGEYDWPTVITGVITAVFILMLNRTRLKTFSVAIALVVASAGVYILGLDSVAVVGDTSQIAGSFPRPTLPTLSLIPALTISAMAIGLLGLIQSSGVSQSSPNPNGEFADASKDFSAQGIANMIAGTFRGLPLGGSIGGTAILVSTGAKSRWANVFLGMFVIVFVLFLGGLVELAAMPAVAAILIIVGIEIVNVEEIRDVWDIDTSKRVIMIVTFLATVTMPVQQAIIIGVFLSVLDHVYTSSQDVRLVVLRPAENNTFVEEPAPETLADHSVTILYVRGSAYFAAVRTIEQMLPSAKRAQQAVVIIRGRGVERIGSTLVLALERYAADLHANGGRLMLSGISEKVLKQLQDTETTETVPEDGIFLEQPTIGDSTREALAAAQIWLAAQTPQKDQ